MKVRKYVIRKKNIKDMYFGGWGQFILTDELHALWYNRNSEDVYKFFSKSEAKYYARRLTKEGYNIKIVKLKRAEWLYDGGDN